MKRDLLHRQEVSDVEINRIILIYNKRNVCISDPTGVGNGGESVWGLIEGPEKRFFQAEYQPKIRHSEPGLLSMVSLGESLIGSQFFLTLGSDLTSLDGIHCVIGHVVEGLDILRTINEVICDNTHRPYKDVRVTHTVILDDPFENPRGFREVSRSPSPSAERLKGGRIAADEDVNDTVGKTDTELAELRMEREAKARATILEIIGDLPDAEIAPPENVLFVCKLNSVTTDDDLEIIFSRFGKIVGCEVIRDRKSGDSLQYAFIEFEDQKSCEMAYFKMDNVLIDDRRIHVDFSQSVSKLQWRGKGRGLIMKDGSKDNRLDFNNYNKPNRENSRGGRNDRGDRMDRNERGRERDNRQSANDSYRQNDRRNRSPPRRYDRPNDRRDRPRSRSPYDRRRFDNRRGNTYQRKSPDRNYRRDNERSNERNPYRRNSPDRNLRDVRRNNQLERRHERSNRSPSPDSRRGLKRSPSVEKYKSHQKEQKEKKSNKKASKKSKNKKDKKHKKKKSGKKHKKHSSSESSNDSDSSSSTSSSSS